MTVFALLGATGLYILYAWLLSAIVCSYLSARKGYGERPGLASGLLLLVVGVVIWIVWPAREDSVWKKDGAFGYKPRGERGGGEPPPPAGDGDPSPPPG